MFRAILLQLGATLMTAVAAGLIVGENGAVSAGLGGGAVTLPNFLFALRLTRVAGRRGSYAMNFFLGEFIKLAATVAILLLVAKGYADLHWPSLLIGMVLALQAGFLAFWKKS
jgi:ATP synthase protein I